MAELRDIHDRMFNVSVRIGAMWPFPQHEASDAYLEAFRDFDDAVPEEIAKLFARWGEDEHSDLFSGDCWESRHAHSELASCAYFAGAAGYLAIAETPVFTKTGEDSASFSWGHYRRKLIFSTEADGLLVVACEWAEAEYQKAMQAAKVPA